MQAIRSVAFVLLMLNVICSNVCHAQATDTTLFVKSVLSVTQNGFSFIPSFSLGKPALIFEPAIGNKRLTFEPQFRFALEGKPWSFIFIYRYKVINEPRFQLQIGGHIPSINFMTDSVGINGTGRDVIVSRRFLAGELIPNYKLSEKVTIGMYILRGHGFDAGSVRDSFFTGLRASLNNLDISGRIFFRIVPQLYYLKVDENDGTYITNTITLAMRNFPLSVSNVINKAFQSDIPARDFDWNVSLIYTFDKNYLLKK